MRLLFISQYWPPEINGESLVAAKLVAALSGAGVECDVVCGEPTYASEEMGQLVTGAREVRQLGLALGAWRQRGTRRYRLGRTFVGADAASWLWARQAPRVALEMARHSSYDAVVSRSLPYQTAFVGHAVAKRTGLPWVCSLFDPPRSLWPDPYRGGTHWLRRLQEGPKVQRLRKVLPQADVLVFPSHQMAQYIGQGLGVDLGGREVVLASVGWAAPAREGDASGQVTLLHTGSLFRRVSPRFLAALKRVVEEERARGVRVGIRQVGEASPEVAGALEEAGLAEAFAVEGVVDYQESLGVMQEATALLLLEAQTESGIFLPSKLADYAACGKPVLMWCPPRGPVAELVGTDHPGFMGQTEEGALQALRGFMEDVREGRDLGRWALDSHRYSQQGVAEAFARIIERAVEHRAAAASSQAGGDRR